jgi:hypothetical protein
LDLYRSHLDQVLSLYFKDESLVFLIMVWLSRCSCTEVDVSEDSIYETNGYGWISNNYFTNFIDGTCPLSPELRSIDEEEGFYLYQNETDFPSSVVLRGRKIFEVCVLGLINKMADAGNWYSKVASTLVKSISNPSP